jgi:predicted DNA-binding transcriptional regulator AlpA
MAEKLQDHLAYPPRGLRADRAAAYLGMSTSKFLELVEKGKLSKPMHVDGMTIWDRLDLDADVEKLKTEQAERKRNNTVDMILGIERHG